MGLAIRSRLSGCKVIGYGHRQETLDTALAMGALDEAYAEVAAAVRGADCVVLCTPVGLIASLLNEIGPHLAAGAVVTDVGSTKQSIVEAAEGNLPPQVRFVGSHPMAGSEKRGIQFARADLFEGAVCILTPTAKTDPGALGQVESLWRTFGMMTTSLSPQLHDQLLADVSHLPHAVASALVAIQDDAAFDLCGKGFLDMTRIAAGDAGLWRDILLDNRANVLRSIRRLGSKLQELEALLEGNEGTKLEEWLRKAADRRQAAIDRR